MTTLKPKTLDEAIRAALATENFEKMETQREDSKKPRYCRVNEKNDDALVKQIQEVVAAQLREFREGQGVARRQTAPQPGMPQPEGRKKAAWQADVVCYRCGGMGHIAKMCPSSNDRRSGGPTGNVKRSTLGPGGRPVDQAMGQEGVPRTLQQ